MKQIRTKRMFIFYYKNHERPHHEIEVHKQVTSHPERCEAYKTLQSMLSKGEARSIGYRTQYENEIDTH